MAENPRIEELRRRVQNDPASIAFAQLAEEYRRAGTFEDAIATCRAGLTIHPGYLSARVTLGRALIEIDDLDGAQVELDQVLRNAPENLAAIRGLAEIHHRRGHLNEALTFYKSALALAKHDPDLEQTIEELSRAVTPEPSSISDGLSFEQAAAEFLAALDELEAAAKASASTSTDHGPRDSNEPQEPAREALRAPEPLPELERFLDAIHSYRQRRAV